MCEGKELATERRSVVTAERVEDIKYKKAWGAHTDSREREIYDQYECVVNVIQMNARLASGLGEV